VNQPLVYGDEYETEWGIWIPDADLQAGSVVRCATEAEARNRLATVSAKVPEFAARHALVKRHAFQWVRVEAQP
jgi:hypothetical protein